MESKHCAFAFVLVCCLVANFFLMEVQSLSDSECDLFSEPCVGVDPAHPSFCNQIHEPVCGVDGITYLNSCHANFYDAAVACTGERDPSAPCRPALG